MTGSSQASAGARGGPAESEESDSEHDAMLETLDVAIDEARRKVESGRIYDNSNERTRIKWIRALAYSVNVRRQVTQDKDLEELAEEIEAIKDQQGIDR